MLSIINPENNLKVKKKWEISRTGYVYMMKYLMTIKMKFFKKFNEIENAHDIM